jgi:carbonic anhydrase/acetyltransferase-like protein (isoleucine patch superfamily)
MSIITYRSTAPSIPESVFVAPGAHIIGDVAIGERSSIWFNATVRGDVHFIRIGSETNIQDNSVLHVTHDTGPLIIGNRVTAGHSVTLHACTIEDETLIGMGAVVLDGAVVESHAMVAAGALVPPGMRVAGGTLVGGVPAKVLRELRPEEIDELSRSAARYVAYAEEMRREIEQ